MTKQIATNKPLSFEERTANAERIKAEYLERERQKTLARKPEQERFSNVNDNWTRGRMLPSDWSNNNR